MIKKYSIDRKFNWLLAVILFILEVWVCICPVGWLREDVHVHLEGIGLFAPEVTEAPDVYYQQFRPAYSNLESIELYFEDKDQTLSQNSSVIVQIISESREVLFEQSFTGAELTYGTYVEIPVHLDVKKNEIYDLRVECVPDSEGKQVVMGLCSKEEYLAENGALTVKNDTKTEEWAEAQLLTAYNYENVITDNTFRNFLIVTVITMFGIGIGIPEYKYSKIIIGTVLLCAIPWVLGQRLESFSLYADFLLEHAMKWNMLIMFGISVVILLWTRSFRWSILLTYIPLTVVYTANYFVNIYRGTPLKINDFAVIGTAAEVVGGYRLIPDKHITMAWCILILFVVYGWQCGGLFSLKKTIKEKLYKQIAVYAVSVIVGGALLGGMAYKFLYTDFFESRGFVKMAGVSQQMMYQINGYLVSTCIDIRDTRVSMSEPEGYSEERVYEILETVQAEEGLTADAGEELPHVILVMNESYSDLRDLGNLVISEENMEFFYSLQENTIRGRANVSVLGGGTANSEFEVFTGATLGFFPSGYYGYQQGMYKERNSLVSLMEDAGYKTFSIHPETKLNWNRNAVYNYLGFDESYWIEDFEGADEIHSGVSDLETYYKVEEIYENLKPGEKMFVFDLTIQNHGGYLQTNVEPDVSALNVSSQEADVYLSLIKKSDEAFEQLINYFSEVDDKVIICMYGDHQPSFSSSEFRDSIYAQTEDMTETDKALNQYVVPFVIWANYDIEEKQDYDISLNYLGALLAKTAGVPLSPYFTFLNDYMEKYPMITINGYKDTEGSYYPWSGQNNELLDYRILQYNYMFDDDIVTKKSDS